MKQTNAYRFLSGFFLSFNALPYLVLGISMVLTGLVWQESKHHRSSELRSHLQNDADVVSRQIADRIHSNEFLLHAAEAFVYGSENVKRQEWKAFTDSLEATHFYPGIVGIGYSEFVPLDATYDSSIVFWNSDHARALFQNETGLYAITHFQKVIDEAIGSGETRLSQTVPMVEADKSIETVMILAPVYDQKIALSTQEDRKKAIKGVVFALLDIKKIISSAVNLNHNAPLLQLYDVTQKDSKTVLYQTLGSVGTDLPQDHGHKVLVIGGRKWAIDVYENIGHEANLKTLHPNRILVLGSLISLMLFVLLLWIIRSNDRIRRAKSQLEDTKDWLQTVLNSSTDGMHVLDMNGALVLYNPAFAKMLGYETDEMAGKTVFEWDVMVEPQILLNNLQYFEIGKEVVVETRHAKKDGTFYDAEITVRPFERDGKRYLFCSSRDVTEKNEAVSALNDHRALLRNIIDTIPIRIFWKDTQLRYLGANRMFAKDAGLESPSELIGKSDDELSWKDLASLYQFDDQQILSGKEKINYEEPQKTPEGKTIWLNTSKVPLLNQNGEIVGVLGIYDDVTERKEAEASIWEAKEKAQSYLDIVDVMIMVLDQDKTVQLINRKGCEILGYEAQEMIGKNFIEHFIPQNYQREIEEVGSKLLHDEWNAPKTHINPVLTKSGEQRLIAWRNTTLFDLEGNAVGILTSGEDITERRKMEENLSLLSQVVRQNPYPTVITDTDAKIQYVNESCCTVSGFSEQELVGQRMSIFKSGTHTKEFYQKLWGTLKKEKTIWKGTLVDRMKNGEIRDCLSTIFPLFDRDGTVINFVSIKEDVTERNMKDRLFLMQTRQAQMGEMISMIAHQWRQPLAIINAIVGRLRINEALKENEDPLLIEELAKIESQSLYLSNTITDFRSFFKPDKEKERTTISTILTHAMSLVDHSIKNHGINLKVRNLHDPIIETYSNEVLQVFITLIKNSMDAFAGQSVEHPLIDITIDSRDGCAILRIEDNAGGIAEDIMDHIFLPYFTTKTDKEGTGLGLYMSKMVIEEHCGGSISVLTDHRSMTAFTIKIPISKEQEI